MSNRRCNPGDHKYAIGNRQGRNNYSFRDAQNNITTFNYTPAKDFVGQDTFTYTIADNDPSNPLSVTGTITITVTAVNDAPIFNFNGSLVSGTGNVFNG